ncbi:MAG: hypothetical protein GXX79_19875 [Actinomycetales bacterium]|nr:hypothetical protein [Actinomycetales bacterium]
MQGRRVLVAALASLALTGAGLAMPGAVQAADGDITAPIPCPEALPMADAVDGMEGIGFTVERGTTPEPFSAKILGRIQDGILPGVDMIMAEIDSPAVERAGGVWQGMSGSPVYTKDGKLIGAVAYGLSSGPTSIIGLTPGESMKSLVTGGSSAATVSKTLAGPQKIAVSKAQASTLAATDEVTASQASAGFQRLLIPLMTNAKGRMFDRLNKSLSSRLSGFRLVSTGSSAAATQAAEPEQVVAGGNFAAAISYGSLTLSGVGTTTMVCGDEVVAFGHPMQGVGRSSYSAHVANAVYVQPDSLGFPFKVANLGGVVGTVAQDKNLGIVTTLGSGPTVYPVISKLTGPDGTAQTTTTQLTDPTWMDYVAANHVYLHAVKVMGSDGSTGSGSLSLRIEGAQANGTTYTIARKDHVSADDYFASYYTDEVYYPLEALVWQQFQKKAKVTRVVVSGTLTDTSAKSTVSAVRVLGANGYGTLPTTFNTLPTTFKRKPGSTIKLRLTLKSESGAATYAYTSVKVPTAASTSKATGTMKLTTGKSDWYWENLYSDSINTYPKLVSAIQKARTFDEMRLKLTLVKTSGTTVSVTTLTQGSTVIAPYSLTKKITVL